MFKKIEQVDFQELEHRSPDFVQLIEPFKTIHIKILITNHCTQFAVEKARK